jgi:hypothetical protein
MTPTRPLKTSLTPEELRFIGAVVYEGSGPPFTGPATEALRVLDVYGNEIPLLGKAFIMQEPEGKLPPFGAPADENTRCPWGSRDEIFNREEQIRLEALAVSSDPSWQIQWSKYR